MSLFGASKLPPISPFAQELLTLSLDATDAEAHLIRVCRTEPELSIRMVAIANSVVYRRGGPQVLEVTQAIRRVGLERTRQLAVAMLFGQQLTGYLGPGMAEDFWLHSLAMATAAQEIARCRGHGELDSPYLAGLVHDLGYLVQEVNHTGSIAAAVAAAVASRAEPEVVEARTWGADHAAQATELLNHWHAPAQIVAAIADHHHDGNDADSLPAILAGAERLARAADITAHLYADRTHFFAPLSIDATAVATSLQKALGLNSDQIRTITAHIVSQIEGLKEAARAMAGGR